MGGGWHGAPSAAGVCVESAGQIHTKHGAGQCGQLLAWQGQLGRQWCLAANAQQGIDGQIAVGRRGVGEINPRCHGLLQSPLPIGAVLALARPPLADADVGYSQFFEFAGRDQTVATVVARAAGHPDSSCAWVQGDGQSGGGFSGKAHQEMLWRGLHGLVFYASGLRHAMK